MKLRCAPYDLCEIVESPRFPALIRKRIIVLRLAEFVVPLWDYVTMEGSKFPDVAFCEDWCLCPVRPEPASEETAADRSLELQ